MFENNSFKTKIFPFERYPIFTLQEHQTVLTLAMVSHSSDWDFYKVHIFFIYIDVLKNNEIFSKKSMAHNYFC